MMKSKPLTRRDFLKLTGAVAAGVVLGGGCTSSKGPSGSEELRRPDVIQFFPATPSRVVHTHHTGVWLGTPQGSVVEEDNALLDPVALRQMLDASIVALTGLADASTAWATLFRPHERVALKVCTFGCGRGSSDVYTHPPLVMAVAEALQEVGIPPEQIVIFDRQTGELKGAGFTINRSKKGIRCYGTHFGQTGWQLMGDPIKLADVLLECDALINIPLLKAHGIGGMTFALKSHYGTFNKPQNYHKGTIEHAIAELNALPPIKERTRLTIGDVLVVSTTAHPSAPYWTLDVVGDSILMSFDPVAHDAVGLELLDTHIKNNKSHYNTSLAKRWLKNAAELGLGTNDKANMELIELSLP
ncbi:MAG: DUF362 domain-containing protein [Anaerolineae bacterium]|nr:DUF362 domain-containing protein [Anaerolineae bacterium]